MPAAVAGSTAINTSGQGPRCEVSFALPPRSSALFEGRYGKTAFLAEPFENNSLCVIEPVSDRCVK